MEIHWSKLQIDSRNFARVFDVIVCRYCQSVNFMAIKCTKLFTYFPKDFRICVACLHSSREQGIVLLHRIDVKVCLCLKRRRSGLASFIFMFHCQISFCHFVVMPLKFIEANLTAL